MSNIVLRGAANNFTVYMYFAFKICYFYHYWRNTYIQYRHYVIETKFVA